MSEYSYCGIKLNLCGYADTIAIHSLETINVLIDKMLKIMLIRYIIR